jgi:16S rRNA (guanine966-N2)-methyltransferase
MSLRIQRGRFKGRTIKTVTTESVRPTTGRVRQRVMDTLSFLWPESVGVDAFAGSGVIGIEALSAGARQVYACESSSQHARFIQESTALLKIPHAEYALSIQRFEAWWAKQSGGLPMLDWVYLDPPYGYQKWDATLRMLVDAPCVSGGCFLLVEQGPSAEEVQVVQALLADTSLPLALYKRLDCGDTQVWLLEVTR